MATKKLVKQFIRCIQQHDATAAAELLADSPDLAEATASSPPKKYDGQSMLQIAVCNGASPIVEALVEAGADVNFMESSSINDWNTPVLHDALNAAVWSTLDQDHDFIKRFVRAIRLLLERGADPNRPDSKGMTALQRFLWAARDRVGDVYVKSTYSSKNDRLKYLKQLHDLLLQFGAAPDYTAFDGSPILNATARERVGIG